MKTKTMKLTSIFLTLVMIVSMLGMFTMTASAAESETTTKAIMLGTDHITGGMASNIYFGTYQQSSAGNTQPEGTENVDWIYSNTAKRNSQGPYYYKDPIKWRVLSNSNGKAFLLSDKNLDVVRWHEDNESVTYKTSTIRSWLNGYDSTKNQNNVDYSGDKDSFYNYAFSANEKALILETTVETDVTDKIFLLSTSEAQNTSYGFTSNEARKSVNTAFVRGGGHTGTGMHDVGSSDSYWSRSLGTETYSAARVRYDGKIGAGGNKFASTDHGVRPAFNLNLSSVLFTSAASGGKADGFNAVSEYTGNEWKLTMLDSNRSSFTAEILKTNSKTYISYSGAMTGENEYISAMIKDANGNVTYYGRIANATSASGTVTLDLSGVTLNATDTLYIFNEQYNGDYKTDYASELKAVEIPTTINAYDVTFNANGGTGTMEAAFVKAGETYTLPENGFVGYSEYFIFQGWSYAADGAVIDTDTITPTADTVLYAIWNDTTADVLKSVEEAVAALEQAKTALQEAIDSKADAATVNAKLAELEARIKALEDVKDAYKDADATLKSELEAAIEKAKNEAIESAKTLVNNAKTELQAAIDKKADTVTLNEKVAELNEAIETAEATAKAYADTQDEALKKALEAAIEKAKNEAIASAETLVNNAKTELQAAIDEKADTATLNEKVDELNKAIETAEATAKAYADTQDEALKKELEAAIEKAKNEAIASAETLVNNAKTELQAAIDEKADTATLNEKVAELNEAIETAEATAKAYADTQDEALKKALEQALANAESTLREAISGVQSDLDSTKTKLDQAIADLNKAIADGDADLSAKIAALNEALASAKAALEAADAANKADLESQISNARSSLRASINKVQSKLDEAVAALEQAIADGDTDLSGKIIALNTALDNAISAYQAADSSLKSELTAKIDEADAALQAAINALASELGSAKQALEAKDAELAQADADNKAALEAKDAELQTFIIIVSVISGLAFCGCGTIAVFYVIDKRKKTSL